MAALFLFYTFGRPRWTPAYIKLTGGKTVGDVMDQIGADADAYWKPLFDNARVTYPPDSLQFVAFKEEAQFEVWAADRNATPKLVKVIPVTSQSGTIGPKRREFDRQVPEGVYSIIGLNPNSSFHLSMKVDYPNKWDVAHTAPEDAGRLGGDIFVHGGSASIGCIALGNDAIEKVFALVARTGTRDTDILIAPFDFRDADDEKKLPDDADWYVELYAALSIELEKYPRNGE